MIANFQESVAVRLGMDQSKLFGNGLSLRDVLTMSPIATNSIDLLEAFAGAIADNELDDQIDMPAFTLDHGVDEVMENIKSQLK